MAIVDAAKDIGSFIGLVAFVCAVAYLIIRSDHIHKQKLIQEADSPAKAKLVAQIIQADTARLVSKGIPLKDLSPEQRAEIAQQQLNLDYRHKARLIILMFGVVFVFAAVWVLSIFHGTASANAANPPAEPTGSATEGPNRQPHPQTTAPVDGNGNTKRFSLTLDKIAVPPRATSLHACIISNDQITITHSSALSPPSATISSDPPPFPIPRNPHVVFRWGLSAHTRTLTLQLTVDLTSTDGHIPEPTDLKASLYWFEGETKQNIGAIPMSIFPDKWQAEPLTSPAPVKGIEP